ncbi:MAG: ABC transporter permease [Acetobacteraceae bacterium]
MSALAPEHALAPAAPAPPPVVLDLHAGLGFAARQRRAVQDLAEALRYRRLVWTLGWLDIRLRYRGSALGPFWLTLSTAIMVAALGLLYSRLLHVDLHSYLPFLALSMVLWNFVNTLVTEACLTFTQAEMLVRSLRMPFAVHAARVVVRNVLVLGHNVLVIVLVLAIFRVVPGPVALLAIPAFGLWLADAFALCLLLGAFCARFRDIPPIVASVMQIAFFVSPIIWRPELLHHAAWLLPFNPFYTLFEILRGPILGSVPGGLVWASALGYSAVLLIATWLLFVRVRGRIAFWL